MNSRAADVAIIGAGVAGVEAARVLHDAGVDFVVLEARERTGGRVFTVQDAALPIPIELGAEFVHGSAPELRQLAREAGITVADIDGERWQSSNGRLRSLDDFWELLNVVMGQLSSTGVDRSFEQFLTAHPARPDQKRARTFALHWVKGFHAADPSRVSEQALAEGGSPGDDVREQRLARVLDGYDAVPKFLGRDIADRVRFGSVVTDVHWERRAARVEIRESNGASALDARAVIVTLPLGVLNAARGEPGAVAFHPSLEKHDGKTAALSGMEMGTVVRLTLRLRDPFWTTEQYARRVKRESLDRLAFLHTQDEDFPVWWTSYPIAAPMLVAWCGGPRASDLASLDDEQIIDRAIAALGRQFRMTRPQARRMVAAAWLHNWERDPYSRGAYSYMLVGGKDAPAKLARPIERTLFFAGEASDSGGRTGTVHGAIASGRRAAKQLLRAL